MEARPRTPGFGVALGVAALLLACAALDACGSLAKTSCEGTMWLSCRSLGADECAGTAHCKPVPGSCRPNCESAADEKTCGGCTWDGTACHEPCAGATSAAACAGVSSLCRWDGSTCANPCATLADPLACSNEPNHACTWIACDGSIEDQGACSSYSAEACPTRLGCSIRRTNPASTQ